MPRRPLRIFAIPLAKSLEANIKTPVVYWHVSQRRPPVKPRVDEPADDDEGPSTILTRPDILAGLDYAQPKTWPHWATLKASETWLSLSNTQREGSILKTWKYKTWKNGERLMDRIDFEEWGLKNVDVGLDPWTGRGKKKHKKEEAKPSGDSHLREKPLIHPGDKPKLQLFHPPSLTPHSPLTLLTSHLTKRIPYHRTYLTRSLVLAPFLLPIGIIPVLPNLPLFYVLWRAWSHWRAAQGGEYILKLVHEGHIEAVESVEMEEVIAGKARMAREEIAPDQTSPPTEMLNTSSTSSSSQVLSQHADPGPRKEGLPSSEEVDTAPDVTATPSSKIYHPDSPSSDSPASPSSSPAAQEHQVSSTSTSPQDQLSQTPATRSPSSSTALHLLFPPTSIPTFAKTFDLAPHEVVDLTRAVDQVVLRIEKAEKVGLIGKA